MSSSETRALRTATAVLLLLSATRWCSGVLHGGSELKEGTGVLDELQRHAAVELDEAQRRAAPLAPGERLDPNRDPAIELDRLPGVGPATAEAMVREREVGGAFLRPQDVLRVPGVGPATLEKIGGYLDFSSPPLAPRAARPRGVEERLDVTRASLTELEALPGIGPALAQRILDARRERPFTSVDDLLRVRGVGPATLERLRPKVRVGRFR